MTKKNVQNTRKNTVINENLQLHRTLKNDSYRATLYRVRGQLPKKRQRFFSRFIHARGMDPLGDSLSHTLARPWGIIYGSSLALIACLIGVYIAKTNGYNFNYLLFFVFYVIGYFAEMLIEYILKFFFRFKN